MASPKTAETPSIFIDSSVLMAASLAAGANYLATYDQKHLLAQKDQVHSVFGLTVMTPADVLLILELTVSTQAGRS
jgi:predicted nucleic acid-binding protein